MPRVSTLLARLARGQAAPLDGSGIGAPPPRRRTAPSRGVLRRERRALARAREQQIRDLGGLILEMYRQDRFREDLVAERCGELLDLEERIHELDALLAPPRVRPLVASGTRCACGAPIIAGAHFCAHCGRATADAPVAACANCGEPLPADARFCGACGSSTRPLASEPVAAEPLAEPGAAGNGAEPAVLRAGEPAPPAEALAASAGAEEPNRAANPQEAPER